MKIIPHPCMIEPPLHGHFIRFEKVWHEVFGARTLREAAKAVKGYYL